MITTKNSKQKNEFLTMCGLNLAFSLYNRKYARTSSVTAVLSAQPNRSRRKQLSCVCSALHSTNKYNRNIKLFDDTEYLGCCMQNRDKKIANDH